MSLRNFWFWNDVAYLPCHFSVQGQICQYSGIETVQVGNRRLMHMYRQSLVKTPDIKKSKITAREPSM